MQITFSCVVNVMKKKLTANCFGILVLTDATYQN